MYAVVGTDGVVYGPVAVGTLYEWIAQGRLVPTSELIDRQGRRLSASMAPELQGAFQVQASAAYPRPDPYAIPMAYLPSSKKKSTAMWLAFLLGFVGAHRFYLGHKASGAAMLVLNLAVFCFVNDVGVAIMLAIVTTVWLIVDMAMIASGALRQKGT